MTDHDRALLFEPLIDIVRTALPHLSEPPVAAPADADLKVGKLLRLARGHGVLPLVLEGLRLRSTPLPERHAGRLRGFVVRLSLQTLALRVEIARMTRLLNEGGVPFIVLKGVAVHEAYGDRALRSSVDNDILIRREDFATFERLAVREGGYSRERRSPWQKRGYLFVHGQYTFRRTQGDHRLALDVHTRVMPLGYRYAEDAGDLLARGRTTPVEGVPVPVPSWEDLMIVLCVNGLKDQWSRLRLVTDLAAVMGRVTDWTAMATLAARANSRVQVAIGLALVHDLFGLPVPAAFALGEGRARRLAGVFAERLRHSRGLSEDMDRVGLLLGAQDDLRSRVRYAASVALRRMAEPWVGAAGSMTADPD